MEIFVDNTENLAGGVLATAGGAKSFASGMKSGKSKAGLLKNKARKPLGSLSKNALNARDGAAQSRKQEKLGGELKAKKSKGVSQKPFVQVSSTTSRTETASSLPRSAPQEVGGPSRSEAKASTSFSTGVSDEVIPHSPSDEVFRKSLLQEAVLARVDNIVELAKKEKQKQKQVVEHKLPPSPTDIIFQKDLRREALVRNAKSSTARSSSSSLGKASKKKDLPPSPSDLELHRNLRQDAIKLNALKVEAQASVENLVSKFDSVNSFH